MTHSSQNSASLSFDPLSSAPVVFVSVSSVLTGPPLLSHDRLRLLCRSDIRAMRPWDFYWNNANEHVEVHNTITMRSYQWVRVHKLLITQFPQESGRKVKSLSDKWEKLRNTYSKIKKLRNQTGACVQDDGTKFSWYNQIDKILSLTANTNGVPGQWSKVCPYMAPRLSPLWRMVARSPTKMISLLGCTHRIAPIRKLTVEVTNRTTEPLHEHAHQI